jgi:predicted Zn-ribbon and HTH transcriptional regulator
MVDSDRHPNIKVVLTYGDTIYHLTDEPVRVEGTQLTTEFDCPACGYRQKFDLEIEEENISRCPCCDDVIVYLPHMYNINNSPFIRVEIIKPI